MHGSRRSVSSVDCSEVTHSQRLKGKCEIIIRKTELRLLPSLPSWFVFVYEWICR